MLWNAKKLEKSEKLLWATEIEIIPNILETDLKVFVVVMPKEGWARVATPILLLV